jgi:hypothetical protein
VQSSRSSRSTSFMYAHSVACVVRSLTPAAAADSNFSSALNATGKPILFNICGIEIDACLKLRQRLVQAGVSRMCGCGRPRSPTRGALVQRFAACAQCRCVYVGPDHIPFWWWFNTTQDPGQGQGGVWRRCQCCDLCVRR